MHEFMYPSYGYLFICINNSNHDMIIKLLQELNAAFFVVYKIDDTL